MHSRRANVRLRCWRQLRPASSEVFRLAKQSMTIRLSGRLPPSLVTQVDWFLGDWDYDWSEHLCDIIAAFIIIIIINVLLLLSLLLSSLKSSRGTTTR